VTLTIDQRRVPDRMVSSGKPAAGRLFHVPILLLGGEGPGMPGCWDEAIAEALGVGLSTIVRVRKCSVTASRVGRPSATTTIAAPQGLIGVKSVRDRQGMNPDAGARIQTFHLNGEPLCRARSLGVGERTGNW